MKQKKKSFRVFILLLFFVTRMGLLNAQSITVQGVVTEADTGDPLPGVSVIIKGTTIGTATDLDGRYSLQARGEGEVLVFSFIGMLDKEVAIGNQKNINVAMESASISLDEVVAIGYGVQRKENLTGSVAVIKNESLTERPVKDAVEMLQGVAPGLNISRASGNIGETANINIRGTTTLGEGSDGSPLVLIDGIEGDLSMVNPQDIDNISVLKDAASSSIYGSRAPFGVILITTKRGQKDKTVINYNNNLRSSSPNHWPNVSDSETFAYVVNDSHINSGDAPFFSAEWLDRIIRYKNGENVPMLTTEDGRWLNGYNGGHANDNWLKAVFKDRSFSHEHNLSINGGSEKMQYYISGAFIQENGLLKINNDSYKRYNITGKINASPTSFLDIQFMNTFSRKKYERPTRLNDGIWDNILRQGWPIMNVYDDNGHLFDHGASPVLKLRDGGEHNEIIDANTHQLELILKPFKDFRVVGSASYKSSNNFRQWYHVPFFNHDVNEVPYNGSDGTESRVNEYAFKSDYYNLDLYSDYEFDLKGHNLKVMVGGQYESFSQRDITGERTGLISTDIQSLSTTTGIDSRGAEIAPILLGGYDEWAVGGFFGRLNYNYKHRYLLEANLRYDGSSRFRKDNRWLFVPSFSIGWNISEEDFFNVDIVDQLKVRASYGSLGNQNTHYWYPTYITQPVGVQNGSWLVSGSRPNTSYAPGLLSQDLTWEKVESFNYGLDFALLNSKLSGSFDYFVRNTLDMVGPGEELPNVLGASVPSRNNTDLQTYGWDFSIGWNDRVDLGSNQLHYGVTLTLSDSQTEVTKYPNKTNSLSTFREGQKLGEIWGYETIGIAKTDEEMKSHVASLPEGGQFGLSNLGAGDIMYKDLNNDGRISPGANTLDNPGDRKIIGNNTPRYRLGTTLNASYKGFDIRAFFQGVLKRDYATSSQMFYPGGWVWGIIVMDEQLDYFRADADHPLGQNLDPYYARPHHMDDRNRHAQTKYLLNASYVRLKNLTLGYTFPNKIVDRIGISKLRVYLSGENLFTITGLTKIYDPEFIRTDARNSYPISRTYSVGLNITL